MAGRVAGIGQDEGKALKSLPGRGIYTLRLEIGGVPVARKVVVE